MAALAAALLALLAGLLLFGGTLAAGCGPTSRSAGGSTSAANLRVLDEHRALMIIGEVLAEDAVAVGPAWSVEIAAGATLDVDYRLGSSGFGIEWISEQDRADLADALPEPASNGQLRIVPGMGENANAQVLLLDHAAYEFANEREAVQSGVPAARETEERLRRDVRDFLHYVRGQGGL
jgi:hypothetical protein